MFGYLVAASELLEEEQQQRYKECYCGLCRSLDRCFGSAARLTLNYDLTFLVLLLSSLYEPEEEHGESVCPRHPAKRQQWMTNEISGYAANMNVALAYLKCLDDWYDDHSLTAYAEARTLKRWYEEISERYPRQCGVMRRSIEKLGEIEKSGICEPDAAADTFGELMEQLFIYKDDRWSDTLGRMAHALGRFIYLCDAIIDLEDDAASGSYNPFKEYAGREDNEQRFRDILKMQLGECVFYFDKLPLVQDAGLMQNILCVGLWAQFNKKYSRKDL